MPPEKTALSIQSVSVSYEKSEILSSVSFDVGSGEIFGLIGLNGAGKTTLIKTTLGLRRPDGGQVHVLGKRVFENQKCKTIAYLPERFEPPPFLNGMEFIAFSVSLYGKSFKEEEAITVAEQLALEPSVLKKRVKTYSKGMRQKLGLIATLLTDVPLIILDEPMSGLDPVARMRVKKALSQIKASHQTVFICSHVLADLEELCDQVAVLHDKGLRFIGAPRDLIKKTKTSNLEQAFLSLVEN